MRTNVISEYVKHFAAPRRTGLEAQGGLRRPPETCSLAYPMALLRASLNLAHDWQLRRALMGFARCCRVEAFLAARLSGFEESQI